MDTSKYAQILLVAVFAAISASSQAVAQDNDALKSTHQVSFHIVEAVYSKDGTPIPINYLVAPTEPGLLEQILVTSVWSILAVSIAFSISYIIRYYTNKNLKSYLGTFGFFSAGYFIFEKFAVLLPYNLLSDKFIILTGLSFLGAIFAHMAHHCFPSYLSKFMPDAIV